MAGLNQSIPLPRFLIVQRSTTVLPPWDRYRYQPQRRCDDSLEPYQRTPSPPGRIRPLRVMWTGRFSTTCATFSLTGLRSALPSPSSRRPPGVLSAAYLSTWLASGGHPTRALRFWNSASQDEIRSLLGGDPATRGLVNYIPAGVEGQAVGVLAEIHEVSV